MRPSVWIKFHSIPFHHYNISRPRPCSTNKITYQFIGINHPKLQLLDALQSNVTVSKVFRCHAKRRCAGFAWIREIPSTSCHLVSYNPWMSILRDRIGRKWLWLWLWLLHYPPCSSCPRNDLPRKSDFLVSAAAARPLLSLVSFLSVRSSIVSPFVWLRLASCVACGQQCVGICGKKNPHLRRIIAS